MNCSQELTLSFFPALPLSCLELPAKNQVFVITQALVNYNPLQQPHVPPWTLQSSGGWKWPSPSHKQDQTRACVDIFQGSSAQKHDVDLQPLRWYYQRTSSITRRKNRFNGCSFTSMFSPTYEAQFR